MRYRVGVGAGVHFYLYCLETLIFFKFQIVSVIGDTTIEGIIGGVESVPLFILNCVLPPSLPLNFIINTLNIV